MNNKNFAGQKLDGRSFRGDLQGADFSWCSLKSCDFRDADLTGANFYKAEFGISDRWVALKFIIGFLFCFYVMFGSFALSALYLGMSGNWFRGDGYRFPYVGLVIFFGQMLFLWLIFELKRPMLIIYYNVVAVISYSSFVNQADNYVVAGIIGGMTILSSALGVVSGAVVVGCVGSVPIVLGLCGFLFFVGISMWINNLVSIDACVGYALVSGVTVLSMAGGIYFRHKAIVEENNSLLLYRKACLIWDAWGGVRFSGAKLISTDFSWSKSVRGVSFCGAEIIEPKFFQATNLHLARTDGTRISPRKIRALLVENKLLDLDLSGFDLQALSFVSLNFSGVNFYKSDLSEADFSGCDLRGADLSEATVLGTNFERAQLTGATIDQWNTDKRTCFDGVDCEYVYTKRDKIFKNPPHGTFKAGEFSKLYQEIANTVDFIVHTPEELQALLRAIESIKQQGGEIVIQSLERKNESVVVRTQSPEAIDKAAIYAQVREEMDSQIQLLKSEHEKQLLTQRIELSEQYHDKTMDSLIRMASQFNRPSSIIMNDHSRTITNSTLTNSAANLGDHSTVSNNVIEQVADAQLRTDLQKLHDLLTHSTLPADDKKQAQQSVTELAQASDKPAAERKSITRRSLAFLKELREDLGSMADLGVQYGETLARVVLWFQGL